jgi:hypothetical protein
MTNKTKTTLLITLVICIGWWFIAVFCLHIYRQVFVMPALNVLEYQVAELSLNGSHNDEKDICIMGLRMSGSPAGLSIGSAVPFFADHRVSHISLFLFKNGVHACNVIVTACPDKIYSKGSLVPPSNKALDKIFLSGNSISAYMDQIHKAKLKDISWLNLIHDAKITYLLTMKSIITPFWYNKGKVWHIQKSNFSGYLAEGKDFQSRDIKELTFSQDGILYQIIIVDRSGCDFTDFMRSIRPVRQPEADEIINGYFKNEMPRDIVVASKISNRLTADDLEESVSLIEKHQSRGEKTVKEITSLKSELEHLKASVNK